MQNLICPKCKRPYNMSVIKASIWLKGEYRTKAEVTFLHDKTHGKHRFRIPVKYAYDEKAMIAEAGKKFERMVKA